MSSAAPDTESPLSERELEVLKAIAAGRSNKEAAVELSASDQTVKNHLRHIFEKLQVNDRHAERVDRKRKPEQAQ